MLYMCENCEHHHKQIEDIDKCEDCGREICIECYRDGGNGMTWGDGQHCVQCYETFDKHWRTHCCNCDKPFSECGGPIGEEHKGLYCPACYEWEHNTERGKTICYWCGDSFDTKKGEPKQFDNGPDMILNVCMKCFGGSE